GAASARAANPSGNAPSPRHCPDDPPTVGQTARYAHEQSPKYPQATSGRPLPPRRPVHARSRAIRPRQLQRPPPPTVSDASSPRDPPAHQPSPTIQDTAVTGQRFIGNKYLVFWFLCLRCRAGLCDAANEYDGNSALSVSMGSVNLSV